MASSVITDKTSAAAYLAIALVYIAVALSLSWLQVEQVIAPAASQIVRLGIGAVILIGVLRMLELYAGRSS